MTRASKTFKRGKCLHCEKALENASAMGYHYICAREITLRGQPLTGNGFRLYTTKGELVPFGLIESLLLAEHKDCYPFMEVIVGGMVNDNRNDKV